MRILCVLLLVLPLLFPGPCAEGVRRGLALAAGSALPALFPFFVTGELLTAAHADRALSCLLAPLLRRIYALPQAGAAPVVLGLTGGYPVGAALLCADGRVFQGCNIENASFGLTNCAERTAMFKAVSEGAREFTAIAIASRDAAPWPCGACRQVLNEFAPNIRVLVTWQGGTESATLPELLPHGFGPQQLTTKE